jgi:hypothetical protein
MRQKNKVIFLTADHLEEQADARASEAKQLPKGGARQNARRSAAVEGVYFHEARTRTTNRHIEIVDVDRKGSRMSDFDPEIIQILNSAQVAAQ